MQSKDKAAKMLAEEIIHEAHHAEYLKTVSGDDWIVVYRQNKKRFPLWVYRVSQGMSESEPYEIVYKTETKSYYAPQEMRE